MFDDYDRADEYDDLRAQVRFERRRRNKLMRHPDPRDPDYPFDDDDDACDTEDMNGDLAPGHLDEEADPLFWLCNTCEASDRGSPVDLLEN